MLQLLHVEWASHVLLDGSDLKINYDNKQCTANGKTVNEGDAITIDGSSGIVYVGDIPTVEPKINLNFKKILEWSQKSKSIGIRAKRLTLQKEQNLQESLEDKE